MDRFTSAMLDFFQAAMARGEDKTAERVRGFSGSSSASSTLRDDVGSRFFRLGCRGCSWCLVVCCVLLSMFLLLLPRLPLFHQSC